MNEMALMRQCAWCLRLMNDDGERISQYPVPKQYNATHGMCCICGVLWLEQVARDMDIDLSDLRSNDDRETAMTPVGMTATQTFSLFPV
jgi:hypothetical protein